MGTLTSATSILLISVPGLYDTPVQLQGYATDDVSDIDSIQPAETMMGVDGIFSAGWVPVPVVQNYNFQGDSDSIEIFETIYQQQQPPRREVFRINGTTIVPAVGRKYTMTRGVLTGYVPMPPLRKVIQPRKFTITWESITWAPR